MTRALPASFLAYRLATTLLSPLVPAWLDRRVRGGKEDPERLGERRALRLPPRPGGPLVWAHGASIGETQSLLPVVEALCRRGFFVVVTSGTRTSAEILARRLPPGARHQYVPLDVSRFMARFLDHWRPGLALFAESEIWPNAVVALSARHIPLVLVNARLSERSFAGWQRVPKLAEALFGRLAVCLPQSEEDGVRLADLGAPVGPACGNLKFDIAPLPADPGAVEELAGRLAGRPIWMAASTHPGEDEAVIAAHLALARRRPGLLTILAPRHPERGAALAELAERAGLPASRRREGAEPGGGEAVHIVDTVGELGLFFRLAPVVFMGGSLVPHGGQNPIEPARLGGAILHGPYVHNFTDVYGALDRAGGARLVAEPDELAAAVEALLDAPAQARDMARRAGATARSLAGALARTIDAIEPLLPRVPARSPPG